MKRTSLAIAIGTLAMLLGSGCRVTVLPGADTYETCFDTSDCGSSSDLCVSIPSTTGGGSQNQCTSACSDDADCVYGGRCLSFDSGGSFWCVQSCTTSSACEIGWSCNDVGDGRGNVCLPGTTTTPTQDTYESCSSSAVCISAADECISYTTDAGTLSSCTHSCTDDGDCAGGRCLSLDDGASFQCMQTCTSDAVCTTGWSCNTIDAGSAACLPGPSSSGILAYDECPYGTTPDPCTTGTGCWGVTVDGVMAGLCSDTCASDAECPTDARGFSGICLAFPSQPSLCFESCTSTAECQVGWACKNSANGISFPSICVPIE